MGNHGCNQCGNHWLACDCEMISATNKGASVMDYEAIDKAASFYCKVAQDSTPQWSIEDVCVALRHPMPVSENDLKGLIRLCDTWSIRCNIDQDPVWLNCLEADSK